MTLIPKIGKCWWSRKVEVKRRLGLKKREKEPGFESSLGRYQMTPASFCPRKRKLSAQIKRRKKDPNEFQR